MIILRAGKHVKRVGFGVEIAVAMGGVDSEIENASGALKIAVVETFAGDGKKSAAYIEYVVERAGRFDKFRIECVIKADQAGQNGKSDFKQIM